MRWGIWYAGTLYGGPRWCHAGHARGGRRPPRLEYASMEMALRSLPFVGVVANDDRSLYSVWPLLLDPIRDCGKPAPDWLTLH